MIHGGDIYRNQIELDYSVNINPIGIPDSVHNALKEAVDCCFQYPDYRQDKLKEALADYEQSTKENILCGNGSSELLIAIIHALKPKKAVIPVPSFYGYEHAAIAADSQIIFYQMNESDSYTLDKKILSVLTKDVDMLYLGNPNNPTGQLIPIALFHMLLKHCSQQQIYVVCDECFLPFCEEENVYRAFLKEYHFSNLIRLRALTKTFSIPGVRLGYLICTNQELCQSIQKQLPEWNVSIFAQMAGVAAVKEQEFLEQSRAVILKERDFLTEKLTNLGCTVYQSAANFLLFHCNQPLYEGMCKKGILLRDCSNFRGLGNGNYRIAVKRRVENEQMLQTLSEVMREWNKK